MKSILTKSTVLFFISILFFSCVQEEVVNEENNNIENKNLFNENGIITKSRVIDDFNPNPKDSIALVIKLDENVTLLECESIRIYYEQLIRHEATAAILRASFIDNPKIINWDFYSENFNIVNYDHSISNVDDDGMYSIVYWFRAMNGHPVGTNVIDDDGWE